MKRVNVKKIYQFIYTLSLLFLFLAPAGFLNFGNYLKAQNATSLVGILNLAEGQVLSQNYTFKFETTTLVDFVEIHFIRLDVTNQNNSRAIARRETTTSNYWYYDLDISQLENGIYQLQTMAILADGTALAGQNRRFTVNKVISLPVNLQIIEPTPEQILKGKAFFVAQTGTPVSELTFSVYNNFNILVKQYISQVATSTDRHQVEVNTTDLGSDGKYKLVVNLIDANGSISEQSAIFYTANAVDQSEISSTTTAIRVSIISPTNNQKLSGKVLLQAKVTAKVDSLYFVLQGKYIPTDLFDNNIWQAYILSNNFPNGGYDLLAKAQVNNQEYFSSIIKIFFNSPTSTTEYITDSNKQTSTSTLIQPLTPTTTSQVVPIFAPTNTQATASKINLINDNNDSSIISEIQELSTSTNKVLLNLPPECLNEDIQENVTCQTYFKNQNQIATSCLEKILNIPECQQQNEQCQRDGVNDYQLCERYLTEPRSSRWCDLVEFKSQPLCANYISQPKPTFNISSDLNPFCVQQSIFNNEQCQKFLSFVKLPSECKQAGIVSKEDCQNFLNNQNFTTACQLLGTTDSDNCRQVLVAKYQTETHCLNETNCQQKLDNFVNELAAREISNRVLEQAKIILPNNFVSSENIQTPDLKNLASRLPVQVKDKSSYQLKSAQSAVVITDDRLVKPLPALLVKDTDQDGLPDDIEKRLGTNPDLTDTDGDGYSDLVEVKNGYNPLLANEKWQKNLAGVEKALLQEIVFEQPVITGQESNDLQIESITNTSLSQAESTNLLLRGTGPAYTVLSLYFYSDIPLLATVQVDEFGRWQYTLSDTLTDGEHQVYLAINDDTGKIQKKSSAQIFFVNEAKAVSAGEYIDLTEIQDMTLLEKYYLEAAAGLIFFAVLIFFLVRKTQKNIK